MKRNFVFFTGFAILASLMSGCKSAEIVDLPRGGADKKLNAAVDKFVEATTSEFAPGEIELHSIMIVRHGKVLVEKWFNGADPQTAHPMWSVSKTFTSAAAGLAIAEGRLTLTDKVISFFPDKLPEEVSENLAGMTVRDLLIMSGGHDKEPSMVRSGESDWVEGFLSFPVTHKPGEYFTYNSLSTYMVSAILQKLTGETVLDYLDTRLFQHLHIEKPTWTTSPQGISCGGWGLSLKTEDMAKMGQLLLQNGEWNGKQVLPADWVHEMSHFQTASSPNGTRIEKIAEAGLTKENSDWVQGYGYQMWITRHGAFRADGAYGQYIIVMPEQDAVIAITTQTNLYQPYLDLVWKYILPAL